MPPFFATLKASLTNHLFYHHLPPTHLPTNIIVFYRGLCCLFFNAQSDCATRCSGRSCTDRCNVNCGVTNTLCGSWTCSQVTSACTTETTTVAATTTAAASTCSATSTCTDGTTGCGSGEQCYDGTNFVGAGVCCSDANFCLQQSTSTTSAVNCP